MGFYKKHTKRNEYDTTIYKILSLMGQYFGSRKEWKKRIQRAIGTQHNEKILRTYGTLFCTEKSISTNIQSQTGLKFNNL
jgi:hypothetical protein